MRKLLFSSLVVAVACASMGVSCHGTKLFIDSPAQGDFVNAASVTVSGHLTKSSGWALTVNGNPVPIQSDGTWSTVVPLDANAIFNPILAEATRDDLLRRQRVVVVAGDSRADGAYSEKSVALRLNDSGLNQLENVVSSLVNLDLASLLPPGTQVITNYCVATLFGACIGDEDVVIASPAPSFASYGVNVDSMAGYVAGDVQVNTVVVYTNLNGSGVAPSCGLKLTADVVNILGDYTLAPDSSDPNYIDVNLIGQPGVSFSNFNSEFTSGICDFPLIGDLIALIIGDVQPIVVNGLRDFLSDPDGSGPLDSPIADGIETALANISIAGPIGQSLGAILDAPLFTVNADNDGVTLGADSSFVADCTPPPGAPDLLASYHVDEAFPTLGATTPVGGLPYDLGMAISTSAFNQLLRAQVECGLLLTSLTELSLDGGPPQPLTAGLLAPFLPSFNYFDPATPLRIDIQPTLAPIVTGAPGPAGELADLHIAGLTVTLVVDGLEQVLLRGQVDTEVGLNLDVGAGSMSFLLTPPAAGDVHVSITDNTLGANVGLLENFVLPGVVAALLPDLAGSLGQFPLPSFLGFDLSGVEVSRSGQFMSLFTDLTPAP